MWNKVVVMTSRSVRDRCISFKCLRNGSWLHLKIRKTTQLSPITAHDSYNPDKVNQVFDFTLAEISTPILCWFSCWIASQMQIQMHMLKLRFKSSLAKYSPRQINPKNKASQLLGKIIFKISFEKSIILFNLQLKSCNLHFYDANRKVNGRLER